jgi:triosephosphate isomerase (TIM)
MTSPLRKPLIAGNWKMHLTLSESEALARAVLEGVRGQNGHIEVALFPPFTALVAVARTLEGGAVRLGGQNMHAETKGAFTGEISPVQLKDVGCAYALLGHSERRQLFGETDAALKVKLQSAFAHGLTPVLCVGETLDEREDQKTFAVLKRQLSILEGLAPASAATLVIAYEPVWAIGTGRTATPAIAEEAHRFIRDQLKRLFSDGLAQGLRILYGGSVKADNIDALMAEPDLDGALVGGASLKAEEFLRIVQFKAGAGSV